MADTFDEALDYIRPHPFTNGPVVLKSGMLRCCVSAILVHAGNLERERDDYRDDSLRLHREKMDRLHRAIEAEAALTAALARVERLEEALRTVDQDARDHIRSDEIAPALLRPHALRAVRQALSDPSVPDLKETREGAEG